MDTREKRVLDEREKLLNELNQKKNKLETCKAVESGLKVSLAKVEQQRIEVGEEIASVESRLSRASKVVKAVQRPLSKYICDVLKRDDENSGTNFFEHVKAIAIKVKENDIRKVANG